MSAPTEQLPFYLTSLEIDRLTKEVVELSHLLSDSSPNGAQPQTLRVRTVAKLCIESTLPEGRASWQEH